MAKGGGGGGPVHAATEIAEAGVRHRWATPALVLIHASVYPPSQPQPPMSSRVAASAVFSPFQAPYSADEDDLAIPFACWKQKLPVECVSVKDIKKIL